MTIFRMKKIYYLLFVSALVIFSSCQKPEFIEPTAERQGITSLTAYFTTGKFVDQQLAKLDVTDESQDYFVIEIPWFFPEETEDPTTIYMSNLRIRAELAPYCKIDPPLTILDLNQETRFTYTNAQGESRPITITGKRTKSKKCNLMTFALTVPYRIDGFINDETQEIYLFTTDDINGFSAEATACSHASVQTDLTVKKNYNNEQQVTVVAQDGKTTRTYKIVKKYPTKIPYGFREASVRQLFNFDAASRLGFPTFSAELIKPSLAFVQGYLVACLGNGDAPVYMDGLTGVKQGTINIGSAPAAAITSDEGGNLILSNHAEPTESVEIYRTKSVDTAPVLFHSFKNETDVPVGYHIKVHGNIDTDAVIILTHEGVDGVTATSKYTRIVVSAGKVTATETMDVSGLGIGWGSAPTSAAKVVPVSNKFQDGVMMSYYTPYSSTDARCSIKYVNGNGVLAATLPVFEDADLASNHNSNVMDSKTYNNASYLVHLVSSYFPNWSCGPQLRVFDITSPTSIKDGTPVLKNEALEYELPGSYITNYSAADVIMAPSADGFKVFIFYFDHHSGIIGGYVADCIKI
jgi:hypothetical protein